jgi:hypothetical protein
MLVRVNYGWKAGQIQDIEFTAARIMLIDGRASKVDYEPEAEATKPSVSTDVKDSKPAKKRAS